MVLWLNNTQREIVLNLNLLFAVLGLQVKKQAMKSSFMVFQPWGKTEQEVGVGDKTGQFSRIISKAI